MSTQYSHQADAAQAKRVLSKAICRAAEALSISRKELALLIGLSEASISRLYSGQHILDPQSKHGEIALTLLRIYRSLSALMGDNSQHCHEWLYQHNHHLRAIPIEMMQTIQGLVNVANYLDAMRGKI